MSNIDERTREMIHDEGTNNKLLILFILDKLEMPINEELLLQICSIDNVWIPYFYCAQAIEELVSGGLLSKSTGPNRNLISLTTDGRTCLSHFYNDIAASLREQITEFVKAHRINYRKKQEFVADYFRNPDGSFTVTLKILEVTKPLFELKFNVATRSLATSIYNSWNEKAPDVYCAIYETLIEN